MFKKKIQLLPPFYKNFFWFETGKYDVSKKLLPRRMNS